MSQVGQHRLLAGGRNKIYIGSPFICGLKSEGLDVLAAQVNPLVLVDVDTIGGKNRKVLGAQQFVVRRLIEKGSGYSAQDRRDLLTLIAGLLHDVAGSYRTLAEKGQIELSTTPYAHPILPLMIDFETARETIADALIPDTPYPGGQARAEEHITLAKTSHARVFGQEPAGCWPAEGAVSDAAVSLLGKHGFSWCATGEAVLHPSLGQDIRNDGLEQLYQPWLVDRRTHTIACFFRDDRLSDLIGFEYSRWDTHDAVANFMHELALVREHTRHMKAPVVSIIMDGENAWEHYHENGVPFLKLLYESIAEHPEYELTTFSDYLGRHPAKKRLAHLVPGSWVYGNFATWIGDAATGRPDTTGVGIFASGGLRLASSTSVIADFSGQDSPSSSQGRLKW